MTPPGPVDPRTPTDLPSYLLHYIGGSSVDSLSGTTFPLADPVSNQPYAQVAAGEAEDIERAVQSARAAFESSDWADMPARARARVLVRIADQIEANDEALASYESF